MEPKKIPGQGYFLSNQVALRQRYPSLAQRLDLASNFASVDTHKDPHGNTILRLVQNGREFFITPPLAALQSQLDDQARALSDRTKPILMVGLYPGVELVSVFELGDDSSTSQPDQQIYVVIDSILCLWGFMKAWDATAIIHSSRVHFIWHEDFERWVEHLRHHAEIPHLFTLISGAQASTLQSLMPPLVDLVQERERSTRRLILENNEYYSRIHDGALRRIIRGEAGRRPRLMMPTCSWSTFIQYSTRDLCAAFDATGWEIFVLKVDSMLTPYYLAQTDPMILSQISLSLSTICAVKLRTSIPTT